jgi:2-hydroxy-3-keto-5-methylthiopentenyl-1-phosphate phosphatase
MPYNIHDCFYVVSKEYRDKQHIVLESDEYHIEQDHKSSYNFRDSHWKGDVIEEYEERLEQEFDLEER